MFFIETWKRAKAREARLKAIRAARRLRDYKLWVAKLESQFKTLESLTFEVKDEYVQCLALIRLGQLRAQVDFYKVHGRPK